MLAYKKYVSAYSKDRAACAEASAKPQYYCDVCEKSFNGPQPYGAHMTSKAHREELELRREYECS